MASRIHAAAAPAPPVEEGLPFAGMHDLRLRPRLLRHLLAECLPLPDPDADLEPTRRPADLARALRTVRDQGLLAERASDPGLLEEWHAAVDAWVDRLVALLVSDREHSCWVGTSFLGLTFEGCSDDRFAKSYSDWFKKILKKLKAPSSNKMEKAADLLGLIMKLFPSSVYRHFNKKLASTLALLPCVRVSHDSLSLMIQKILVVVNNLLNDTFGGLDEGIIFGFTGHEIMIPLISPGSKPPPQLGGQATCGDQNFHSAKKFCTFTVPTISALVNIPVPALVTFIQRVLLADVTSHKSLLQSDDRLHQELIVSEILVLHSNFLDLLGAIIKGMCSSLLPHAGSIVTLVTEYFKRAKLPALRRKIYAIVRLLLSSMGVGMGMHLLQVVVCNISADLDDNSESSLFISSTDSIGEIDQPSSERSTSNNQAFHGQSSTAGFPQPTCIRKPMPSFCVKIAALETFEELLNVGGSFRACYWRTQIDLLIINVARESFYMMGMYELRPLLTEDPTLSDFQLALLKALLASFLSSHECPPYLEPGLELFNRGRLETGTELAKFCSHALLALDVLVHPREHCLQFDPKIPIKRAAHVDVQLMSVASESKVFDSGRSNHLHSVVCKDRATENLGDGVNDWLFSTNDAITDTFVEDSIDAANEMSIDPSERNKNAIGDHKRTVLNQFHVELQEGITSSRTDVDVAIAVTKARDRPYKSPADIDPGGAPISNNTDDQRGGTASGSQNVARHAAQTFGTSGMSGSEWDSLNPFLDIGNFGTETSFSFDMANLDRDYD
uniref:Pre-rRNA-processing protein RIX1 N-terminal domain-containing protein n=1 Tax=Leersia perrieri TaxID=77586 RepID=A0A0D9WQE1_9ORYZ